MVKSKGKKKKVSKLDTVGVVGSKPIAPTISSKNSQKHGENSAFWLAENKTNCVILGDKPQEHRVNTKKTAVNCYNTARHKRAS